MKNCPLKFLFEVREEDKECFGKHWVGPLEFKYGEKTLVAKYKKNGDGQTARVYCVAMPARFYQIEADPDQDSIGKPQKAFKVTFGSGQEKAAAMIAKMIAEGMLGFYSMEK